MKTYRVDTIKNYIAPDSPYWARVGIEKISMMPSPLGLQPTDYIRQSWKDKPYGQTPSLEVASVHDGENWAVRASWIGSTPSEHEFPDALAVALPVRNHPVMATMGAENAPVHMLRWAANKKEIASLLATGIGTIRPGPDLRCVVQVIRTEQSWQLVISRPLGEGNNVAPLLAGTKTGIGFALWQAANDERAGIKAFSIDWTKLDIEA